VANSFAGLRAGARQVECAVNGIGERAGNAALEEIVMLLRTRHSSVGLDTRIETREIARTSRLVSRLTGYPVQPNKAIVGRNAFAHEAGIHQDGVLKDRTTYEIMDATTIGLQTNSIVLGKHSGRHALRNALEELGVRIDGQALNTAFKRFKDIADRKKHVTALDLEAIVSDEIREQAEAYNLARFELHDESGKPPMATVEVTTPAGETVKGEGTGDGAIDALLQAINAATGIPGVLKEYHVAAVTADTDALGEVSVLVEHEGRLVSGQSVSTDTLEASARAYLRALSNALAGVGAPTLPAGTEAEARP
jgi:2-isopropylmalate synthase